MKKKVIIFSYNLDIGGIEKALINLLKNFNYNKYDVTLVLEEKKGIFLGDIPKQVIVKEYKVSNSKNVVIRKMVNLFKRIKFYLENHNKYSASICYATYSIPGSTLSLIASTNPILFIHSNYKYVYNKDIKKIKQFFYTRRINEFNKIVFVSNESKNDTINIIPEIKDKSVVINNLVDYIDIINKSDLKPDYKFDKNKKNILFVGRLEENSKKITRIIELAKRIDDSSYQFYIIGDGPDREIYKNLIKKDALKNIKMLGSKSNPYSYMKQADCIILTSDYEGFPVVYNEAICLGIPILTTQNITDDVININDGFGIVTDTDINSIILNLKRIVNSNFEIKKLDYKKINETRIDEIEKIIDGGKLDA